MMEHLFDCAICERPVIDYDCRKGKDRQLPPICRGCERSYSDRSPTAGAFMDRRKATQISALAEALNCAAHALEWRVRYGRA